VSDQTVNTGALDVKAQGSAYDQTPPRRAKLVVGIRLDGVPAGEAQRLAAEGRFYPLTLDANGFLRVTLPEGTTVNTNERDVHRESRDLLEEIRDLLLKIA
jgi:hypothetical protein